MFCDTICNYNEHEPNKCDVVIETHWQIYFREKKKEEKGEKEEQEEKGEEQEEKEKE